jgi:hypothetical protein
LIRRDFLLSRRSRTFRITADRLAKSDEGYDCFESDGVFSLANLLTLNSPIPRRCGLFEIGD